MYKVNPVKATCIKYKNEPNSIQGMNDTCFGICAAFSNTNDVYNMDPDCSKSCLQLIEDKKKQIYGVDSCDHQSPYLPVIWQQVPRFMPILLNTGMQKEQAFKTCLQKCNYSSLSNQCMEDCKLDYDAVSDKVEYKLPQNTTVEMKQNQNDKNNSNKNIFYVFITIVFVILIGLILYRII